MKRYRAIAVAFLGLFLGVSVGYGLWGEIDNKKPWDGGIVPKEFERAVNAATRVHGEAGDLGIVFCFRGGTKDVNQFLETLAKAKNLPTRVSLVPENGVENHGFGDNARIECDWSVRLSDGKPVFEGKPADRVFYASVTVYCGDRVKVEELKIPLNVEATIGGKLSQLVALHQERRDAATQKKLDLATMPATDDKLREGSLPRGLFAEPAPNPDQVPSTTRATH